MSHPVRTLIAALALFSTPCAHAGSRVPGNDVPAPLPGDIGRSAAPAKAPAPQELDLRSFYPELTDAAFERKLAGASNPSRFLRSFAPAYYRTFSTLKKSFSTGLRDASQFQGWCAGDAHPENFGTRLDDSGKAIFTLVDLDDFDRCSIVADLLHFLLATRLAQRDFSDRDALETILAAYVKGTRGEIKLSRSVRKLLERAEDRTYFDQNLEVRNSEDEELSRSLGKSDRDELARTASTLFGNIGVTEATQFAKTRGGSAGLTRYRLRLDGDEDPVVLEYRTLTRPATIFEKPDTPALDVLAATREPRIRITTALEMTSPKGRSKWFGALKFRDRWMMVSPRFKGNRAVDLRHDTDEDRAEMLKVLRDEAAVLGELHSRGTDDMASFMAAIRNVKSREWESALDALAEELEKVRARATSHTGSEK